MNGTIDRSKLREAIYNLDSASHLSLLVRAIERIDSEHLPELVGSYLDPETLRPSGENAGGLLQAVRAFYDASRRGDYYQELRIGASYSEKSERTMVWMSEYDRLLCWCRQQVGKVSGNL